MCVSADPPEEVSDQPTPDPPEEVPDQPSPDPSWCREALEDVFEPLAVKIAGGFSTFSVAFFVAATAIDDSKRVTLLVCYGLAAFSLAVALVAAVVFARPKIAEGRKRRQAERASRAGERDLGSPV